MIFSKLFKFQDCLNLISPSNLRSFISAWAPNSLQKGYFPYEWLVSLAQLNQTHLPPIEEFYSNLRDENEVTPVIYKFLQATWKQKKMKTMRDFLAWYNNLDTVPFAEALKNMNDTYYAHYQVNLIKNFPSISAFSLFYATKSALKGNAKAKVLQVDMQ